MTAEFDPVELDALLDALHEDAITPADHDRLVLLLAGSADARRRYIQYMLLCGGLRDSVHAGQTPVLPMLPMISGDASDSAPSSNESMVMPAIRLADDSPAEPGPLPSWNPQRIQSQARRRPKAIWAAAAVVLLSLVVWAVVRRAFAESPVVLASELNAHWAGNSGPIEPGAALPAGELQLADGLVELRFARGAKVVIEGPARFRAGADGRMVLDAGKLAATVPPEARGFSVQTPGALVTDLGTEFGVRVADNDVDLFILRGKVALRPNAAQAVPILLTAGQARRIDAGGTVTPLQDGQLQFVGTREYEARANARGSSYDRWLAYSYALRRDPDLIAYYLFDRDARSAGRLDNLSPLGSALDGRLAGQTTPPRWTTGRWPDKGGLAFEPDSAQRVELPAGNPALNFYRESGDARPFTIALWMKAAQGNGSIIARGREWHEQFGIDVADYGYIRAWVRSQYRGVHESGVVAGSAIRPSGGWQHVAAVYDPAGRTLTLYVDGRAITTSPAPAKLLDHQTNLTIGSRLREDGNYLPPIHGTIDELAVFRRALSAGEIRTMYETGKRD